MSSVSLLVARQYLDLNLMGRGPREISLHAKIVWSQAGVFAGLETSIVT